MHRQISSSRRFCISGYTISFAAGVKHGKPVVVFGVLTGLEAVPVFTLEKEWRNAADAAYYVQSVTVIAAEKLLSHYQEHYQSIAEQVNHAFIRTTTGFIAPAVKPGLYPHRSHH